MTMTLTRFTVNLIWAADKEYKNNKDRIQLALRHRDYTLVGTLQLENDRIKNLFFQKYGIILD
jgi:hypothetical protein